MHINNEIGAINDIEKIGEITEIKEFCFMLMQHKVPERFLLI